MLRLSGSIPGRRIDVDTMGNKSDVNKGGLEELAKLKPVRDALTDLAILRQEMVVLYGHHQMASPERVLKLTLKLDELARRLMSSTSNTRSA